MIIIIIIIIIITITIIVIIIIIIITAVEKCGENGVEAYMIAIVSKPPDTKSTSYKSRQVTAGNRGHPSYVTVPSLLALAWNILTNSVSLSLNPLR